MAVYLLYVISPVIVWLFMSLINKRSVIHDDAIKKYYYIVCAIIMALMIGLRYRGVGSADTTFYFRNWEMMSTVSPGDLPRVLQSIDLEYGYQLTVWLLSHVFADGQWLLMFSGVFFSISVCIFTYRNSKDPVISLLVFNCLGLFNFMVQGMRQAIAMSICLFAYEQCKKKHFFKFVLLVAVATLFHASAVVFLLTYFLGKFKLNTMELGMFSVLTLIGIRFLPYAFDIVNIMINDDYDMNSAAESGGVVAILIYAVIICFGLLYKDKHDEHYALFVYSTIVAALAMLLRNYVSGIAERISYYFAFGEMIVLANSISAIRDQKTKVLIKIFAVLLCFGVAVHKASYSELIPYNFFVQV